MKTFRQRMRDTASQAVGLVRQGFRAVLQSINTSTPIQLVQAEALKGEQIQAAELFQHFGLTSSPPEGTQLIILPLGGQTAHSVIVGTEHGAYRITVQQGEVCVYNQWGAYIKLLKEQDIEMSCKNLRIKATESVDIETKKYTARASTGVNYQTPAYSLDGQGGGAAAAKVNGSMHATDDFKARNVSLVQHVHRDSGGSGNSGQPVG